MSAEVFDEERRAWIAGHAGVWMFQKRRAELLGKRLRARRRAKVGARPDPHDDQVTPPLLFRTASTSTGALESGIATAVAVVAPIGWPLGRLASTWIAKLIPEQLQSYPIVALAWAAVISGAPLPLLYNPNPTLTSAVLVPWLLAQVPATFASAAAYGVLEGWLAIDGASQWWPLTPAQRDIDDRLLLGPEPVSMPTLLDPTPTPTRRPTDALPVPRRRPPPVDWMLLTTPAVIAALGILWYLIAVTNEVMSHPVQLFTDMTATAQGANFSTVGTPSATGETERA